MAPDGSTLIVAESFARRPTAFDIGPDGGLGNRRVWAELGGPDGRTLFILAAEWRGFDEVDAALADRTGQVLTVEAPAPHAGRA